MLEALAKRNRELWNSLSYPVQYFLGIGFRSLPERLKFGCVYEKARDFLEESQWWTETDHNAYQLEELHRLLRHSYKYVPYYRRIFDELHLRPQDIKTIEDLRLLPTISRREVLNNFDQFIADGYQKKLVPASTSGSSGNPFRFYYDGARTLGLERAFQARQWSWVGYQMGQRTAFLNRFPTGESFFRYVPFANALALSIFQLSPKKAHQYISKLNQFHPVSIQAFPSAIAMLAGFVKRQGLRPPQSLRVILGGSEPFFHGQTKLVEEAFGCQAYNWYGQTECVSLAGQCEKSFLYHIYTEYGVTEILDEKGDEVSGFARPGEVVATGFINYAMPLVRYRTGDLATKHCGTCICGRAYPLLETVVGRKQDMVVTNEGVCVSCAWWGDVHHNLWAQVEKVQLVQEKPGWLTVRIQAAETVDKKWIERELAAILHRWAGNTMEFEFAFTDNIPPTARGKHLFLVQRLKIDDYLASNT